MFLFSEIDYAALQLRICVITFPFSTNIIAATQLHPFLLKYLPLHFMGTLHSFVRLRCAAAPDLCYYIFFCYQYYRCYAAQSINRLESLEHFAH